MQTKGTSTNNFMIKNDEENNSQLEEQGRPAFIVNIPIAANPVDTLEKRIKDICGAYAYSDGEKNGNPPYSMVFCVNYKHGTKEEEIKLIQKKCETIESDLKKISVPVKIFDTTWD